MVWITDLYCPYELFTNRQDDTLDGDQTVNDVLHSLRRVSGSQTPFPSEKATFMSLTKNDKVTFYFVRRFIREPFLFMKLHTLEILSSKDDTN